MKSIEVTVRRGERRGEWYGVGEERKKNVGRTKTEREGRGKQRGRARGEG